MCVCVSIIIFVRMFCQLLTTSAVRVQVRFYSGLIIAMSVLTTVERDSCMYVLVRQGKFGKELGWE